MKDAKVGMRVVYTGRVYSLKDKRGTIAVIPSASNRRVGISFDEAGPHLHNCAGKVKDKHGWFLDIREVEPIDKGIQEYANHAIASTYKGFSI